MLHNVKAEWNRKFDEREKEIKCKRINIKHPE